MSPASWERHAYVLDQHWSGRTQYELANELGVSKQRIGQMLKLAKAQLAYRVFRGVPRPLPGLRAGRYGYW